MSVASGDLGEVTGGHVKIGSESHVGRNVAIGAALVALAGGIIGFTTYSNKQDGERLAKLEAFRGAYAEKCDAQSFRGEASSMLKDSYLRTDRLQAAVDKQHAALRSGAPCDEIARALRQADFPMSTPTTAQQ
ncbi:MAG: hypothetical protein JWN44_3089 [Myxococcales bacterium]|nr:hypothetical protein [Myxococcales bacterium]